MKINLKENLNNLMKKVINKVEQGKLEKEQLSGFTDIEKYDTKSELNLIDTFSYKHLWKDLYIYINEKYLKVNLKDIVVNSKGEVFYIENKIDKSEKIFIGNFEEVLFLKNNLTNKYEKIDINEFCKETEFLIKGVKVTKFLKEKLDNNFFLNIFTKEVA